MPDAIVSFPHGLGDAVHFRLACELYERRGYEIKVHSPEDKELIFGRFYTSEPGAELAWWQEDSNITSRDTWQRGNKAFRAVNLGPLPHIEATIEELAAIEVRIDAGASPEATPTRPYISLHPQGGPGCYWHTKSLTAEQIVLLVNALLEMTAMDIVLLEWHNPYPAFSSDRVTLEKRPPLRRLANIIAHAAVHIDVDSGPLYLSRLTGTPAIGMIPHAFHHPVVFTLPRTNATYVSVPTPLSLLFPDDYRVVDSQTPLDMGLVAAVTRSMLAHTAKQIIDA